MPLTSEPNRRHHLHHRHHHHHHQELSVMDLLDSPMDYHSIHQNRPPVLSPFVSSYSSTATHYHHHHSSTPVTSIPSTLHCSLPLHHISAPPPQHCSQSHAHSDSSLLSLPPITSHNNTWHASHHQDAEEERSSTQLFNYYSQQHTSPALYQPHTASPSTQPSSVIHNNTVVYPQVCSVPSLSGIMSLSNTSSYLQHQYQHQQVSALPRGIKRSHGRTHSTSSSNRSGSPHSSVSGYQYDSSFLTGGKNSNPNQQQSYNVYQHNLPTPTQTPTQETFVASQYQSQSHQFDQAAMASLTMNRAMDSQGAADDDVPGMSHSGRHSVSSYGPEPATPHTAADNVYDGSDFKVPHHDAVAKVTIPKFDRTMSDIYQDECYNPAAIPAPTSATKPSKQFLSPLKNDKVTQALQAAQLARAQSPRRTVTATRGVSPFRPDSPYVKTGSRTQQVIQKQPPAQVDLSHTQPQGESTPKTISPKDAVLDYRTDEDDNNSASLSLFPDTGSFEAAFSQPSIVTSSSSTSNNYAHNYGLGQTTNRNGWTTQYSNPPTVQPFSMAVPSATTMSYNVLPFSAPSYRSLKSEDTPAFPAQLVSMESSASEAPGSSQSSTVMLGKSTNSNNPYNTNNNNAASATSKPEKSNAGSGTYTCTFSNCIQRFDTPQKLQKHKREAHRPSSISSTATSVPSPVMVSHPSQIPKPDYTPGVGSGMTSAALLMRNSQTGPHKCDRINPSTGKPCNSVFSRPYDLTRHEDTIHNMRKQKVRCALCVEEKTFSRNDALTRHMRVVHPEVDFPGKHRSSKKGDEGSPSSGY